MLHVIASKIAQPHEVLNLQAPKTIVANGTAIVVKGIAELITSPHRYNFKLKYVS